MESILVSEYGTWYYTLLIGVFSTFFGLISLKLGDTLAAIREIAINTREKKDDTSAAVDYEEQYPRMLYIRGFIFSSKALFSVIGLILIVVGWLPMLMLIKKSLGI